MALKGIPEKFNILADKFPKFTAMVVDMTPSKCGFNWQVDKIQTAIVVADKAKLSIKNPEHFDKILRLVDEHNDLLSDEPSHSDKRLDAPQIVSDMNYNG